MDLHKIEIEHEVWFAKLSFETSAHDEPRMPSGLKTMGVTTECLGEIRVRRFRDLNRTVLKALIQVRIPREDIHDLDAEVSVRLAVKGDQLSVSPAEQERFASRLHEIAQQHCHEFVEREICKSETIPLF